MKQGKIGFGLIAIAVVALGIFTAFYFVLAPQPTFNYNGFVFENLPLSLDNCNSGSGYGDVDIDSSNSLILRVSASGRNAGKTIKANVEGVDELLVIAESFASCAGQQSGADSSISLIGTSGGSVQIDGASCLSSPKPPAVYKFKNNFDGTWSSLQSLVGDVFVEKTRKSVLGTPYLAIGAVAGGACGLGGEGTASIKVYNIIRKENAFALCKADKYAYDANADGRIATDGSECFDLATIVLNSEEAIKESFNEKLARITLELEAKNAGLQTDIAKLQQQLAQQQGFDDTELKQQIIELQQELENAKKILADVQAGDKNAIATIEAQEQFKPSNPIINFFNKLIAWLKSLFK